MAEIRVARMSVRVAGATAPLPPDPPDPPTPEPAPPLNMVGVVVGFEHTITPGRWVSTLHTSTSTPSY